MAESGAFAGPEEALIVAEKMQVVAEIDPVFVLLGEYRLGFSVGGVGEKQVQAILRAIQALDRHAAGIVQPGDAGQQRAGIGSGVHPAHFAARRGDHAHARHGIGRACDGVAFLGHVAFRRKLIHEGIFFDVAFVELKKRDSRGIWRPPVRRGDVQFLGIHPVEFAVAPRPRCRRE